MVITCGKSDYNNFNHNCKNKLKFTSSERRSKKVTRKKSITLVFSQIAKFATITYTSHTKLSIYQVMMSYILRHWDLNVWEAWLPKNTRENNVQIVTNNIIWIGPIGNLKFTYVSYLCRTIWESFVIRTFTKPHGFLLDHFKPPHVFFFHFTPKIYKKLKGLFY